MGGCFTVWMEVWKSPVGVPSIAREAVSLPYLSEAGNGVGGARLGASWSGRGQHGELSGPITPNPRAGSCLE